MNKFAAQLLSIFILCGCAATPIVKIPEPPALPAKWGNLALGMIEGSDCPDVQGAFWNLPTIVTVDKQGEFHSTGEELDFYSLFPVYLAVDRQLTPSQSGDEPLDSLTLRQPSPNELILTVEAHDRPETVAYHFIREEGDFECLNGFIQFPVSSTYGMGEGTLLNGQEREKIALVEQGNLVVIKSWGPYRSRKSDLSSKFTHEFYLYHRL